MRSNPMASANPYDTVPAAAAAQPLYALISKDQGSPLVVQYTGVLPDGAIPLAQVAHDVSIKTEEVDDAVSEDAVSEDTVTDTALSQSLGTTSAHLASVPEKPLAAMDRGRARGTAQCNEGQSDMGADRCFAWQQQNDWGCQTARG